MLHLLSLPPVPIFLPWAHILLLTGKQESISADFNTETSSKAYEMNLKEVKDLELEVRGPELFSGLPPRTGSRISFKSLHLYESTSSINWVDGPDGYFWLKILHDFVFGEI